AVAAIASQGAGPAGLAITTAATQVDARATRTAVAALLPGEHPRATRSAVATDTGGVNAVGQPARRPGLGWG
ncbi:hypothetical protein OSI85_25610, partial [Mycobacterium ulcerans]